jgi:hypothetical protein
VVVEFGLGGPEQADLGLDLGGQVGEGHSGVVVGQLQRGVGGGQPLGGALGVLLAVQGRADLSRGPARAAHLPGAAGVRGDHAAQAIAGLAGGRTLLGAVAFTAALTAFTRGAWKQGPRQYSGASA